MPFYHHRRVSIILVTLIIIGFSKHSSLTSYGLSRATYPNIGGPTNRFARTVLNEIRNFDSLGNQQQDDISNDIHILTSNTPNRVKRTHSKRFQDDIKEASNRSRLLSSFGSTSLSTAPLAPLAEKWTLEIKGGPKEADIIAAAHDCNNLGVVSREKLVKLIDRADVEL